ncbi:GxxExxY protein [Negadavirga shengliensis]|uniref:GxxExxY protein n=1 Tax=Negadavirga shengliensis TaxID=1389218 RepID=A0ABV9SZ53_9BACT
MENLKYQNITEAVIRSFYKVYNTLGYGFLEKVYENSLFYELAKKGFLVEKQKRIRVFYDETPVGNYFADLIVEDKVIIEVKAAESLVPEHGYQLINYLKATEMEVGLLVNFGKNPQFVRKVFSNKGNADATDYADYRG